MGKNDDSKLFAFLGIFLTIIGWLIVYLTRKNDKYAMHYAKQGLVLFIGFVIVGVFSWVPIIGWILGPVLSIALFVLWIIGIVYSLSDEMKEIPLVGALAKNF